MKLIRAIGIALSLLVPAAALAGPKVSIEAFCCDHCDCPGCPLCPSGLHR